MDGILESAFLCIDLVLLSRGWMSSDGLQQGLTG